MNEAKPFCSSKKEVWEAYIPCPVASRSGHSKWERDGPTYNRWRLGTKGAVMKL